MRGQRKQSKDLGTESTKGSSAEQLHRRTGNLCLAKAAMETAGELHRAKGRLEARYRYSKGQSVKDWTKKVFYWKKWKFDLGNVCA